MLYVLWIYLVMSLIFMVIAFGNMFSIRLRKKYTNYKLIYIIPLVMLMSFLWLPFVIYEMIKESKKRNQNE